MDFRTFFSNPKIMALSGLITVGCKLIVAGSIALVMNLCITDAFFFWGFILYPIVGLIFDVILYLYKDKIWTTLPDNVSSDWQTTPEQLLKYAKHLPKIRLMRFLTCWFLIPFMPPNTGWLVIIETLIRLGVGFSICSLFDLVWVNIFKLKKPVLFKNTIEQQKNIDWWNKQLEDDFNSIIIAQLSRNSNATAVGSSAWFAQQAFNSRK